MGSSDLLRVFDRFAVAPGATGWVYRYWNRAPVERAGWISSGVELSVQLRGAWLQEGRFSGRRRVEAGETFYLSPAERYAHRYVANCGAPGLQVGFLLFPDRHRALHLLDGELRVVDAPPRQARLVELARDFAEQVTNGRWFDPVQVEDVLLESVRRHCLLVERDPILVAKRELERHFRAPLYIHQIAEAAGMPPASFVRRFSARFGVAPARYRLLLRINAAAQLLWAQPGWSHRTIAEQVGFTDESFFYRAFRQVTGMTPSRYAARVLRAGSRRAGVEIVQ